MKNIARLLILSTAALALPAFAQATGNADAGKEKAVAICSGCHGVPGTKTAFPIVYHVPKIGGQTASSIVSARKAYKAGDRANDTMRALASALSEKEMADIAAYYASASHGK